MNPTETGRSSVSLTRSYRYYFGEDKPVTLKPISQDCVQNAFDALIALRDGMRANDDYRLNDASQEGGVRLPDGEDYTALFDLVLDALSAAGIPYRDGGAP